MNTELKEIIESIIAELDGAGLVVTNWDLLKEEMENIAPPIENELQVKQ